MDDKNVKKHWIKNTKLANFLKENEKVRKIFAVIIVLVGAFLIINTIVGLSNWNQDNIRYNAGILIAKSDLIKDKIQVFGSIIGAVLIFYYGSKLVEKEV